MNRDGHPMGLGWFALVLLALSFVVPPINVTSIGHESTLVPEPDAALHKPILVAGALIVLAFGAFFTRHFYVTELLAVPAFLMAFGLAFPCGLHLGMILWVASTLCLAIAAYRCDAYGERVVHPHPTDK